MAARPPRLGQSFVQGVLCITTVSSEVSLPVDGSGLQSNRLLLICDLRKCGRKCPGLDVS